MKLKMHHRTTSGLLATLAAFGAGMWLASQPGFTASAPAKPEANTNRCRLILPEEIHAVVGREANLYFDNAVLVPNWRNLLFDVACNKGMQQEERWTFVPQAEDIGVHPLTLDVYSAEGERIASGKTTVRVVAADAGAGREVRLLCIGDSLTNASVYPAELANLCKEAGNPRLTLLGTRQPYPDNPECRHEGYGGWTYQRFVTHYAPPSDAGDRLKQGSPFMFLADGKPRYDFSRYVREHCDGKNPDFVTIALGCNDIFNATEEEIETRIETVLGYADTMIAGVRAAGAEIRIGLVLLVPPAASQDAFGANYKCGHTRWQYRRNQHRMVERMMEKYGGREKERLFLIPAYVNLDAARNYPTAEVPANARSTVKIVRLNNGVHPAPAGYRQMADSIYAWMKWLLASGQ